MSESQGNIVSIDGKDHRPWAVISREKLLKAAVSEIAERGYEKARLVDIAAKADLTVGSVYTWYKNKTDLFNAAIEYALTEQQERNLKYLSSGEDSRIETKPDTHWTILISALAPRNAAVDSGPTDSTANPTYYAGNIVSSGEYIGGNTITLDAVYDATFQATIDLSINDAEGANPVTYKVHYFRNVAIGGWAENQNITVTIE